MKVQQYYISSLPSLLYVTYDSTGNLYVDGYSSSVFGWRSCPRAARHSSPLP